MLRSPEQGDPGGAREEGPERNRHTAADPARRHHRDADDRADRGREQQHEREHLPAEPGADRGEQLEVAVAHALLAGHPLEELEHEPEEEISGDGADHGVTERRRRRGVPVHVPEARDQADPQERDRQDVGQELAIDVDARERDQVGRENESEKRRQAKAEMPGDRREREGGRELDQRIADRDRRTAGGAAAAQDEPAQDRDVVDAEDLRLAGGAARAGHDEVVGFTLGRWRPPLDVGRLRAPLPLQHERQAVDDDVQEAADGEPDESRHRRKQGGMCREQGHGRGPGQTTAPSLKIGRYIAMTRLPTSTPRMAMISGSSSEDRPSTAVSTSSS